MPVRMKPEWLKWLIDIDCLIVFDQALSTTQMLRAKSKGEGQYLPRCKDTQNYDLIVTGFVRFEWDTVE